jgi:hypothetical protein
VERRKVNLEVSSFRILSAHRQKSLTLMTE